MQEEHIKLIKEHDEEIMELKRTIYGDEKIGIVGMNQKVDDMHTILIQAKGLKGFFGMLIMIGVLLITIKGWLLGK